MLSTQIVVLHDHCIVLVNCLLSRAQHTDPAQEEDIHADITADCSVVVRVKRLFIGHIPSSSSSSDF